MEKIYCGKGKEKFNGNLIEVSLCLSKLPKEFITESKGQKYIKIKVQKSKEPDQWGNTHYVEVDTFKPEKKNENKFTSPTSIAQDIEVDGELPF
jgi:hypothetical protein